MLKKQKVIFIPVSEILPNPSQPRSYFDDDSLASLTESIKKYGIIQPITVRKRDNVPRVNINGQIVTAPEYELVAGERRWRAAKQIGLPTVPCLVTNCDRESQAYIAFSENVFREDLNCFDIASALQDMLTMTGLTQTELAKKLTVSQSAIANKLRLLRLTPKEREILVQNRMTERHARAFIRIEDAAKREEFIKKAILFNWSVLETEKRVNILISPKEKKELSEPVQPKPTVKRIGKISDIGIFINSIDNAVKLVRDIGVNVERTEIDKGETLEIIISVPKKVDREKQVLNEK